MAIESVAIDDLASARALLSEAIAVQEMATRISGDNQEDFEMLQRACSVTFRTLEQAASLLEGGRSHDGLDR